MKSGDVQLDLWWVKAIALTRAPEAPAWGDVGDGTLVGAIRVGAQWSDVRGYVVRPGVYTDPLVLHKNVRRLQFRAGWHRQPAGSIAYEGPDPAQQALFPPGAARNLVSLTCRQRRRCRR